MLSLEVIKCEIRNLPVHRDLRVHQPLSPHIRGPACLVPQRQVRGWWLGSSGVVEREGRDL